jgi:hypothetical protein
MIPEDESAEQRRYFMAANKTPVASDSAAELRDLIGDDASATFESDPNFIDSNPGNDASSEHLTLRDTDDTEDSEEEDEEFDEEDDDSGEGGEEEEEEDEEEEDDDDDEDEEDDDAEIGSSVLRMAKPINVHGPGKHGRADIEEELEEMEEEGGVEDDAESGDAESVEETEPDDNDPKVDRAIDAALRMRMLAGVASEFAAASGF